MPTQRRITIEKVHVDFIDRNAINLSRFVQLALEKKMKELEPGAQLAGKIPSDKKDFVSKKEIRSMYNTLKETQTNSRKETLKSCDMLVNTLNRRYKNTFVSEQALEREIQDVFGKDFPEKYVRYIIDKMESLIRS